MFLVIRTLSSLAINVPLFHVFVLHVAKCELGEIFVLGNHDFGLLRLSFSQASLCRGIVQATVLKLSLQVHEVVNTKKNDGYELDVDGLVQEST